MNKTVEPEGKMNGETFIVKDIDKTVRDFALKHKINIRRDWNNDYMILENGKVIDINFQPTAKSAICMMKRYIRNKVA